MYNNRRLARIVFTRLANIDVNHLIKLLGQLPKDASIVNMDQDWTTHTFGIVVNSERYREVGECEKIPEIIATFIKVDELTNKETGNNWVSVKLDDSKVVDNDKMYVMPIVKKDINHFEQQYEQKWNYDKAPYGFCYNNTGYLKSQYRDLNYEPYNSNYDKSYFESVPKYVDLIPEGVKLLNNLSFNNTGKIQPRIGIDLNKEALKNNCQHELKNYVGIMQSYKFCTKCDHKVYEKETS